MRILALTAGAARMYCGSCLRDNSLAAELKRQGHDIVLLPLYTPTRTDEPNVSEPKVFLNGISVCLDQEAAFFRKTHKLLDRLWDAPWMLKLASRTSIRVDPHRLGAMTVSMLRGEEGYQLKEIRQLTDWLRGEEPPDIVTLPNSLLIGLARPVREALRRPVCCTLQGEDLFLSQLCEPYRTQALELIRAKIGDVDGFVAVSRILRGLLAASIGNFRPDDARGSARNRSGRVRSAGACSRRAVSGRFPCADRAGEGTPPAGRELCAAAARERFRRFGAGGGRLPGAGASRLPARHRTADEGGRPGARIPLSGRARPGAGRSSSCGASIS